MLAFQSTPKKLLDQTKETILITALEKIHIIGENSKWIFWEAKDRFCIFGKKKFQTGYQELNKGFATWFSTFCENFVSKFSKITKIKQKDRY